MPQSEKGARVINTTSGLEIKLIGNFLRGHFEQLYGGHLLKYRATGRINLIGERTDYNDGFLMPAAIQFASIVAAGKRDDNTLHI